MVDEIIFSSSKIYLCHGKTLFFFNYLDSVLSGFVNSMRRPLVVSTITSTCQKWALATRRYQDRLGLYRATSCLGSTTSFYGQSDSFQNAALPDPLPNWSGLHTSDDKQA